MTSKSNKQTHGNVDNDITTIVLPGWGNFSQHYLFYSLKTKNKLYFEYYRESGDNSSIIFANFQTMAKRFKRFLKKNELLGKPINIVGYSQGGMIALYAAGDTDTGTDTDTDTDTEIKINKYVSIASPHSYAFRGGCTWLKGNLVHSQLLNKENGFLDENGEYALQVHKAFKNNPNAKWLQIYSEKDLCARSDITSSTRFIGNDSKKPMKGYKVKNGALCHLLLPVNIHVIRKINNFLLGYPLDFL